MSARRAAFEKIESALGEPAPVRVGGSVTLGQDHVHELARYVGSGDACVPGAFARRSVEVRHFALTFQVCVLFLGRSSQENASGDPTSHVQHVDPTGMAWRDTRKKHHLHVDQ